MLHLEALWDIIDLNTHTATTNLKPVLVI